MLRTPAPSAFNTYFLSTTTSTSKLNPVLQKVVIQSSYASARWIMAFSGTAVPADGTVPIMAPIYVAANGTNVGLDLGPAGLPVNPDGLILVASSTYASLTKDVAATMDITAFIDEYESQPPSSNTTVGDLTTGVASRAVWAESASPHRLKVAWVKNNNAAARYAVIYAVDTPAAGSRIISWQAIPALTTVELNFGANAGLDPRQLDANLTFHDGCTIAGQTDLVPGNVMVPTDFNIKAIYE